MNTYWQNLQHFLSLGVEFGIGHAWWGIIIPPDIWKRAHGKLHWLIGGEGGSTSYIVNRVCDQVSWMFLLHYLWDDTKGRLSTIDEDLLEGIDYVIQKDGKEIPLGFTKGRDWLEKKQNKDPERTIIQVHGNMLHGYTREIHNRRQNAENIGIPIHEVIWKIFEENRRTFTQHFFIGTHWIK